MSVILTFGDYYFDCTRSDLIGPSGSISLEKKPSELLSLLLRHAGQTVTKEQIVETVWEGRAISDAALSTVIKQLRRAIGDDGKTQHIIKTVHGRGFCLSVPVKKIPQECASPGQYDDKPQMPCASGKSSIAVLKFSTSESLPSFALFAGAVPSEVTAGLSRLQWMKVIASASSLRFSSDGIDPHQVGEQLGVKYLLTGHIQGKTDGIRLTVELMTTHDGQLLWADGYDLLHSEISSARDRIVQAIVAALDIQIHNREAVQAAFTLPTQMNAWSHYHLGLRHLHLFTKDDNRAAADHFSKAVVYDKSFARAHAGMSLTFWQDAFMHYEHNQDDLIDKSVQSANAAIAINPEEPFANFSMGRAAWLGGDISQAHHWYDRALSLNPNYSRCYYSNGLAHMLEGDAENAILSSEQALLLSPIDPFAYGMHALAAMGFLSADQFGEACLASLRAIGSPGAHYLIFQIAAITHELASDREKAIDFQKTVLRMRPDMSSELFFKSFPYSCIRTKKKLEGSLLRLGVQ